MELTNLSNTEASINFYRLIDTFGKATIKCDLKTSVIQ